MQVAIPFYGELEIYTHFFAILSHEVRLNNLVYKFAFEFVEMEWKWDPKLNRNTRVTGKVWGGRLDNNTQFRFPISLLPRFYGFMEREGFQKSYLNITIAPLYQPAAASFKLREHFIPRDYQEEAIAFSFEQKRLGLPSCLLMMPTGTGKTVTLLAFASRLGLRMGMVISPSHMDKWMADGLV